MGAPGRVVRQVSADALAHMAHGVEHYVANWRRYKAGLVAEG